MANKILNTKIKQRIDTTANWTTNSSTILENGEFGLERTTAGAIKIKVGDGTSTWAQLPYVSTGGSSGSGTAAEEIYVGTSAPASGHNYTMWINPNGDELEVSGTYDIVLTYEKTNHEPFDTSTDSGDYNNLEYYLNINDTTHQSLLLNPETGCQLSYDTDWDTILEKYQANQTLVLNLQAGADEDTYTWKLPLLTALLDDNNGGAFAFGYCDNEYFYHVVITDDFGIENATNPILNLTEAISSMPEVDDETITIDETTGKLRTTYGDEIEINDVLLNIDYDQITDWNENETGFVGTQDIFETGTDFFLCEIMSSPFIFPNATTPGQTIKILLNEDASNPVITNTLQQEIIPAGQDINITLNYIGDITFLYGLMMRDSTSLEKITTGNLDYDYFIGTAAQVSLDGSGTLSDVCFMFVPASYFGNNFDIETDSIQIYGPILSNIKIPITASPHKAGKGIQIDNNGKINVLYGKEIGTVTIDDIKISSNNTATDYLIGSAYGFQINGSGSSSYLQSLSSLASISSIDRSISNKFQIFKTDYNWDSEDQEYRTYQYQIISDSISSYSHYESENSYSMSTITFKYGTKDNYEEIICEQIASNDPYLSTLQTIDQTGSYLITHRFIGFYNTSTDLPTWLSNFSLTPEDQSKEALGFYLFFNSETNKWYGIVFSNINDLALNSDSKYIFQNREVNIYNNNLNLFTGTQCKRSNDNTIALGENTLAMGTNSISGGENTFAIGSNSLAFGSNVIASGENSIAIGSGTKTVSDNSLAIGINTVAKGQNSIATGHGTVVNGSYSVGLGYKTLANDGYSIAGGYYCAANGAYSLAFGDSAITQKNNSIALGDEILTIGLNSIALGRGDCKNISLTYQPNSSNYSYTGDPIVGSYLIDNTNYAQIGSIDSQNQTLTLNNTSYNWNPTKMIQPYSVTMYTSGFSAGDHSLTAGYCNRTRTNYQTAIGYLNADNSDALFMIGGGMNPVYDTNSNTSYTNASEEEKRVNAFEVQRDGCYRNKLFYNSNKGIYTKKYRLWDTSLALPSTNAASASTATDTSDIITKYNDLVSKYNSLVSALQSAGIILNS